MDTNRIEALSDSVFAIAITRLIIEIEVATSPEYLARLNDPSPWTMAIMNRFLRYGARLPFDGRKFGIRPGESRHFAAFHVGRWPGVAIDGEARPANRAGDVRQSTDAGIHRTWPAPPPQPSSYPATREYAKQGYNREIGNVFIDS